MAHHLLFFTGSIAQNSVLAVMPSVNDQIVPQVNGNQYSYPDSLFIRRSYARVANGTEVRIDSPSTRQVGPPQIQPIQTSAAPSDLPPINKYDENAMVIPSLDNFQILVSRGGAAADQGQALLWVDNRDTSPVTGACRAIRATATITQSVTGWTGGPITFVQSLPAGRYRIIGMAAQGANLFAARLVLPGQEFRPGVLAQQAEGEFDHEWFRRGAFGDFGSFNTNAPPTLEVVGFGAGSAQTIFLDIVPAGNVR